VHPTPTGTVDRAQELVLAQANAIANQCGFVDVNLAAPLGTGRSIVVGPEGERLHEAGTGEETIPLVLDLDRVRAARARGTHGLGQVLKSFRDAPQRFACYAPDAEPSASLAALGPLCMPTR